MVNNVVLVGRITKDIEIMESGTTKLVNFTCAVNRNFKNEEGEYQADFINCVAFNKTAEYMNMYLKKGQLISVQGRIETGSYEKNGTKVFTTKTIVNQVSSLEKIEKQEYEKVQTFETDNFSVDEDDLPF